MARKVKFSYEKWLTLRDRKVIVSVYHHGVLSSRQVEYLFFAGNNNSRIIALRRLKKLVDNGFLKQHWYGYNKQGTMQHFTISSKGAMIVASELGIDISEIRIIDAGIISNIEHTSLIAEFHVNLIKNNLPVPYFTSDRHNRVEFEIKGKKFIFEPDGKGLIVSRRTLPFYLEIDRGTMSYEYFKLKIPNYEAYYRSKLYLKEFTAFPLVFIISTTEHRIKRMQEIINETSKSDITYLLGTFNDMESMTFIHCSKGNKISLA
jgi:hypothetical protein